MGRSTNETMNVWTHVVGAVLFICLLFVTYRLPGTPIQGNAALQIVQTALGYSSNTETILNDTPRWPITVFVLCAIWCLSGSAIFHNFFCVSKKVKDVLQTLDYIGICILISGSYVPVIYYSFYCYPTYLKIHMTLVIVINVLTVCVLATPKFRLLLSFQIHPLDNRSSDPSVRSPSPSYRATLS